MKWFTDLDEDVRVRLIEEHKQAEMIEYSREITDDEAFDDLKETAWSDDGMTSGDEIDIEYLQIQDRADEIWKSCIDIDREILGINVRYELRTLLIKINSLEIYIKRHKS